MRHLIFCFCFVVTGCAATTPVKSVHQGTEGTHYFLPRGLIHIQLLKQRDPPNTFAIKLVDVLLTPDINFGYKLDYRESAFSEDHLVADLTESGLMDKITLTSEDVSAQVIVKIASLAGRIAGGEIDFTPFGLVAQGINYDLVYDGEFDPFSKSELDNVNAALKNFAPSNGPEFSVDLGVDLPSQSAASAGECGASVCYRPLVSVPLIFKKDGIEIYRRSIEIPDITKIMGINLNRAFGESITKVDFDDGMIKQFDIKHPSGALAVAQLPIDVLNALIAIPAELVQLRIDTSGRNKKLYDAQKAEIEAQRQLIEKLEELHKEKENPSGPLN